MRIGFIIAIISSILLFPLLTSCNKAPEQTEETIVVIREQQTREIEEKELPENFPGYPGAKFYHYFEIRGTDVYEYTTEEKPDVVYNTYARLLRERGYVIDGEATEKYADIKVNISNSESVYIEAEIDEDLTKIRISFFPREFMAD